MRMGSAAVPRATRLYRLFFERCDAAGQTLKARSRRRVSKAKLSTLRTAVSSGLLTKQLLSLLREPQGSTNSSAAFAKHAGRHWAERRRGYRQRAGLVGGSSTTSGASYSRSRSTICSKPGPALITRAWLV